MAPSVAFTAVLAFFRSKTALSNVQAGAKSLFASVTILAITLLAITGCKTSLEAIRQHDAAITLTANRARPVAALASGHLTLHDCKRLALSGNLDIQVALWEEAFRSPLVYSALTRMLPTINARYELGQRDNHGFSRSDVIGQEGAFEVLGPGPGTGVTNFSTGRERPYRRSTIELRWSPMDAAIAYYLSQTRTNETGIAHYQRKRVAQQLVGLVSEAFHRMLALSAALPKAEALASNRGRIVKDMQGLYDKKLIKSEDFFQAKTQAVQAGTIAAQIRLELIKQREILSVAMNTSLDGLFCVAGELYPLPPGCIDPRGFEASALTNRPELYQADLAHFSSMAELRRLCVRYLPRVEGFWGYYRDENKFQFDKDWKDVGVRVTADLLDILGNVFERDSAKAKFFKTDREKAVISLGIMSQVRQRALDVASASEKHRALAAVEDEMRERARVAGEVQEIKERGASEKIDRIAKQRAVSDQLQAEVDRLRAAGEVHAALAALETAAGVNYPVGEGH